MKKLHLLAVDRLAAAKKYTVRRLVARNANLPRNWERSNPDSWLPRGQYKSIGAPLFNTYGEAMRYRDTLAPEMFVDYTHL